MEQYKEGIKSVGDSIGFGCMRVPVMILAIITAILFLSCNDGGTPSGTTVDSTKTKPVDTTKSTFAAINEAVSKIQYVFVTGSPIEMKEGDNYEYLQGLINNKYGTYQIPNGRFFISKTLKFENSNVVLVGSGNTIIDVQPGTDGVEITGGGPTIARIKFSSAPIGNGSGVKLHAVGKLIEVWIHGFGGKGIAVTADVQSSGTNASQSQILFCTVSECGDDGLYFQGGDANACNVVAPDIRDNKGWGINDDSFLGNSFINPMAHNNAKGHYKSENGNNRTVFVAPYGEEDSPPSQFGGVTMVFGGLLGYEVTPDKQFYKGTSDKYRGSGGYIITSPYAVVQAK